MKGIKNKDRIRLMLVRDPEDCVKALCKLEEPFDLQQYTNAYEHLRKRIKPIHIKNAHTHFYSLRIFGLMGKDESSQNSTYRKTKAGREICLLMQQGKYGKVKEKMGYLLLNNLEKGELFNSFLFHIGLPDYGTIRSIVLCFDTFEKNNRNFSHLDKHEGTIKRIDHVSN